MTTVYAVNPDHPEPTVIETAAASIRAGKLVAFPTETVYGIGANALNPDAVAAIYAAKKRPSNDPLIVHIASTEQLQELATDIPDVAFDLARRFWPGPLTLILKKQACIPDIVTSGMPSVAIRLPSHPVAHALIESAGVPIAAPSANLFSRPSSTSGSHVSEDFQTGLDIILDGGESSIGVESTVIDLTAATPTVLRPGGLAIEELRQLVPDLQVKTSYLKDDSAAASPGMLLKHYSPNARVILFTGDDKATILQQMIKKGLELESTGLRIGVLNYAAQTAQLAAQSWTLFELGAHDNLQQISQSLYKGLRHLDQQGVDIILASAPSTAGLGLAIRDRLFRSAEGDVIEV